jgi:predicted lipoprotein
VWSRRAAVFPDARTMTGITEAAPKAPAASRRGLLTFLAVGLGLVVAMAFDTTVVHIGSDADVRKQAFAPDAFGTAEFPRIQAFVVEKAVDALTLAPEVLADKAAAGQKYGTASSTGSIMMVRLTGVVGEGKAGLYKLAVDGMPPEITVRVQTGPAINGTDLRDATGDIVFGAFKNQIEYQDAGSGINRAMKAAILDGLDTDALSGKTVDVVGAFRLVNPKNWMITPVRIDFK